MLSTEAVSWGLNWAWTYHKGELVGWLTDGFGQTPMKNAAAIRAIDIALEKHEQEASE